MARSRPTASPASWTSRVRERAARNNPNKAKPGEKATERAEERAEKLKAAQEAAAESTGETAAAE